MFLVAALAHEASAACNAIPDTDSLRTGTKAVLAEQGSTTPAPGPGPDTIGFKAGLGRMDRFHLLPGITAGFRLQPDGLCVQRKADGTLAVRDLHGGAGVGQIAATAAVVSLVQKGADGSGVRALVLASESVCATLEDAGGVHATGHEAALDCLPLKPTVDGRSIAVRLPDDAERLAVDGTPLRGAVTVVTTSAVRDRAAHVELLTKIATDGCVSDCAALESAGALGCVDRFYSVASTGLLATDSMPCSVTIPAGITTNDFKKKCQNLPTPDNQLAGCDDQRTALQMWQDDCGVMHVPFDWTEISKDATGKSIQRYVAGRSAISRTEKGKLQSHRIWVPGREFLGSTPWDDPSGTAGTTKWRKPEIGVWYDNDAPEEIGLRGSVDEDDSIVHIFPRMAVALGCDVPGDEACMGYDANGDLSCECEDRYAPGCECKEFDPPKFFACDSGDFQGLPCTRHAHCNALPGSANPPGKCATKPTCQKDGKQGVWDAPGPLSGTDCWVDDKCKQVANHPWCGYRLFDIRDHKDDASNPDRIELDAEIASGGRARRGVCAEKRVKPCNNEAANGCDAAQNEGVCRGYILYAEGSKP